MASSNTNDGFQRRKLLLDPLVEILLQRKISNPKHRLLNADIKILLDKYSDCYPWITKGMPAGRLKRRYKKYISTLSQTGANTTVPTTNSTSIAHRHNNNNKDSSTTSITKDKNSSSRSIGGRPIGNTKAHSDNIQECIISANHEITVLYKEAILKSRAKGHKKLQKGLYQKIHDNVKITRKF
jgi:hypothetical protein